MLVLAQSSCFGSHCVNLWQMLAKSVTVESPRLLDSAGKADLSYPLESAGLFLNSWCLRCSLDQLIRISRGGTQPSGVLKSPHGWEQLHRRVRANTQHRASYGSHSGMIQTLWGILQNLRESFGYYSNWGCHWHLGWGCGSGTLNTSCTL